MSTAKRNSNVELRKCPFASRLRNPPEAGTRHMRLVEGVGRIGDSRGRWHPRYRIYRCDCGGEHVFDAWNRKWITRDMIQL